MCLISLAWQAHPDFSLVVAANRDEYHARPTAPSAWWIDAPDLLAGRDLRSRGAWMGVTRSGRFAALTNYRDAGEFKAGAPSRGALVADFLTGAETAEAYTAARQPTADRYNGFNLLTGNPDALWYSANRGATTQALAPGIHGLSNAVLNTPWPKVTSLKLALGAALEHYSARKPYAPRVSEASLSQLQGDSVLPQEAQPWRELFDALFDALGDSRQRADDTLPRTGVPLERERVLSSPMIISPAYGTRASTVMGISRSGWVVWEERSFAPEGHITNTVAQQFSIEPGSAIAKRR